jgi:hypothetical protein
MHTIHHLQSGTQPSYEEQAQMVEKLGANFEIPSLRDITESLFLHKVATGESLLQQGNEQNGNLSTYTRVQNTIDGSRLIIGSSANSAHVPCRNSAPSNCI